MINLISELREWFLPDIVGRLHQPKGLSEAKDCQKQRIVNSKHFLVFFFFFQILFLSCIFGYLVILIVYKWIAIDINSKNVSYWCRPWCHTWAELLVGYHPCFKGFSAGCSGFPPSTKTPTFQIPIQPRNSGQEESTCGQECPLLISRFHFIGICLYSVAI